MARKKGGLGSLWYFAKQSNWVADHTGKGRDKAKANYSAYKKAGGKRPPPRFGS